MMDEQELANARAEAIFWQSKYFEQLLHSTQVIAALNRPMIAAQQQAQAQAQQAAKIEETFQKQPKVTKAKAVEVENDGS